MKVKTLVGFIWINRHILLWTDGQLPIDLVIRNSKLLINGSLVQAGLALDEGKIVKIGKEPTLPSASEEIDVDGHLVLPGIIDAHVHLRDQDLSYKEDFFTGTAAAASGGITLVIDMPNNNPVTMNPESLKNRMNLAAKKTVVNVAFYSAFPEKPEEEESLVLEGAKAFKLYMTEKIGGVDPDDDKAVAEAFTRAAKLQVPVGVHAEDSHLIESATARLRSAGNNNIEAYLNAHSPEAEAKAVVRILKFAKKSKVNLHVCHVSTDSGVRAIASAKRSGLPVSCEVTPHHLLMSSQHLKQVGFIGLTNPPLRSEDDIRSLWLNLQAGNIDILASDHAPHALEEKKQQTVWNIAPGIDGLETLLPLMLTQANAGRLSLSRLVEAASAKPAKIFHLKKRGELKAGNFADLTVVDLKKEWRIDASKFYSKAKFSPFDGWKVKGKPVKTFVNGRLVMDEGEIVAGPGDGNVVR
jgi:dihydroorotase (multifunctional complex type)